MRTSLSAAPTTLLALCGLLGASASGATDATADPAAHLSRTVYLREYGSLRFTREGSEVLYEQGSGSGTFHGAIVARLRLHPKSVEASFTIYPKGGSVTGQAHAAFVIHGSAGYYGGSMEITRATGAYRHIRGRHLGVSGTIDRRTFALTVKANGWISY